MTWSCFLYLPILNLSLDLVVDTWVSNRSERVSTISTTSQLATEARHINLALHYLEQVIVALGDSNRSHIPYRNSMMTSVLRDSLGGNCMTTMIATISLDLKNTQETLSTCRFAQRVAMVTNAVQRNEDLDPNIIITQLKSEVKKLREIIESNSIKPVGGSGSSFPFSAAADSPRRTRNTRSSLFVAKGEHRPAD